MKMLPLAAAVLMLVCAAFASPARGQFAVYGMGSGGRLSGVNVGDGTATGASGSLTAWGGRFGVYDNFAHAGPLFLGGDLRASVQHSSNDNAYGNQVRTALTGLRLAIKPPVLPIRPYVQAEIGAGSTNYGRNSSRTGNFAYQIQGGLDFAFFPHLDLRGEYGAGQLDGVLGGPHQTLQQFGVGLVVRFF